MRIIAASHLTEEQIKKYAEGRRGFVSFGDEGMTDAFSRDLELHGFERINLRDIITGCRSDLRKSVIEFSGALNKNVPHHNWWAIGLSRRIAMYPFSSGLAKLFIMRTIMNLDKWDTCVVCDDSVSPWEYIKNGAHQTEVNLHTGFSVTTDWKHRIKRLLPVSILLWFFRKIIIKTRLGWSPLKIKKDDSKHHVIMFTLIDRNNFIKEGSFRDVYLGDLAGHFKKEGHNVFILGQLHESLPEKLLSDINSVCDYPIALLDQFWSVGDLFGVVKDALSDFISRPPQWSPSHFAGFDVSGFLDTNMRWDLQGGYPDSLLDYRAALICLKQVSSDVFIYPYENKCIEHMLLKALSEILPDTKKIGYQHAVLTPKHIHMFLADGESETLPLPDKIVTNGQHTAHLLQDQGNYPDGTVEAGPALRQTSSVPEDLVKGHPPKKIKKVLMVLAEGKEEYDRAFSFLREIQDNNRTDRFDFRVRLHPGIPFDPFQDEKMVKGLGCTKDTIPSVLESLYWADAVLYASSSVAIQAMAMGIPVVWMDLLDFWGTDPINTDDLLMWKLNYSHKWDEIISEIERLSQDEFNERKKRSKKFVSDCFSRMPINIKKWMGT